MEFTESSALSFESRLCHGVTVEAFEGASVQQQQQDNNSSSTTSSGELLHCDALLYKAAGIKRKAAACNLVLEGDDTGMKCSKVIKPSLKASSKLQQQQQQQQPAAEFPKQDYIHVRARRGQATDSHSLAERVRREKISERMKFLQDLVPGCSKVIGKAVMLDEIINYVQSLQRQIEFLSMKLAAIDSQLDINVDSLMNKELARSPETTLMGPDPSTGYSELQSHLQLQQQINNCNIDLRSVGSLCDAYLRSSMNREAPLPLPPPTYANSSFMDPSTQTLYDGDLQTMVHNMGNSQGSRQGFFAHGPGFLYPGFLKVEH